MSEVDKSVGNQVQPLDYKVRKKRHCLTLERRFRVIQQVISGLSENAVAAELGVLRYQIQGIIKI
jgi:CENP-B N-terminal DNA-binding domain